MKQYTYSLFAAALATGMAQAAATAYTTPVGYETFANNPGFNFIGVRLHEAPIAAGKLDSATVSTVTDNDLDLGALIVSGTYILEITDGSGIIQEVTSAAGTALNVAANLTGLTYPVSYVLRPASTLASVFGNSPSTLKLSIGAGTITGADQVWIFNGTGYTKLYYDEFGGIDEIAGWYNVDTTAAVDATTINLIYADSFIISSATGQDFVMTGEVKTGPTELNLNAGFNFAGSVVPVGSTLATAFGSNLAEVQSSGLGIGAGTITGADQIWLFNGVGYTKLYYDEFGGIDEIAGWYNVDTSAPVLDSTPLAPGFVISAASAKDVLQSVPQIYDNL